MTYTKQKHQALLREFGQDRVWKELESKELPADAKGDCYHAEASFRSKSLDLRFVRERGFDHIDVRTARRGGVDEWVPFEVAYIAISNGIEEEYLRKRCEDVCNSLNVENGEFQERHLFGEPLQKIHEEEHKILEAVQDVGLIRNAELRLQSAMSYAIERVSTDP